MNERQEQLFKLIVDQYIKTAMPVSSKLVADLGSFDLSSATIRNEMALLEEQNYIYHPHTSAGRVPTEKGYQFYVERFIGQPNGSAKIQEKVKSVLSSSDFQPQEIKNLAKNIAEMSDGAVFVAFSTNDFYYTGLANLFNQPEFVEQQLVFQLSRVMDHLDLVIHKMFNSIGDAVDISIGKDNPFGKDCSSVVADYRVKDGRGLIGIIGPMRMDYQTNYSLVSVAKQCINNLK